VAVPALRPPAERSAAAAADSLRHVLARARADAARRGVSVTVLVRGGDGAFSVTARRRAAGDSSWAVDDGGEDSLAAGLLPLPAGGRALVDAQGGVARVTFDATGRARAGRVALADEHARIEIAVDPWSGDARAAP
jgi:hypothetical protein